MFSKTRFTLLTLVFAVWPARATCRHDLVDLLTERLDKAGHLELIAGIREDAPQPRLVRAETQLTLRTSLARIVEHSRNMRIPFVLIGPQPRSNVPGIEAALVDQPWADVSSVGAHLTRLIDRIEGPWALMLDLADEDLNETSPMIARLWHHVRRIAEGRSLLKPESIGLYTTFANLTSPRVGQMTEVRDRAGGLLSFILFDLIDRPAARDDLPDRKTARAEITLELGTGLNGL